jgi:hypothetical protein
VATITITQESHYADKEAARLAAARSVAPAATSAVGTKFDGIRTEGPSAEHPHGASFVTVLVDEAAVLAAAATP